MKIGYGWDSHEFKRGIPLKIGGVTLQHPKGLGGHSDGDVLLHAITDALLGAVAAPDIGSLFSPSDARWKGADSALFLAEALKRVRAAGYALINMDSTLILAVAEDRSPCRHDSNPRRRAFGNLSGLCRRESEDTRRYGDGQCSDCPRGGAAGEATGPKAGEESSEILWRLNLCEARVLSRSCRGDCVPPQAAP